MSTEIITLKVSLKTSESTEDALYVLQRWLEDSGISVQLDITPPAEDELGGRLTALLLAISISAEFTHLPPSIEEALKQLEAAQEQQENVQIIVHSPGFPDLDDKMREKVRREQWHIEIQEPKQPRRKQDEQEDDDK